MQNRTGTGSKTTLSLCSPKKTIRNALVEMAMLRGATPAKELIERYCVRLSAENEADVLAALAKVAEMARHEGELAFPELGALIALVNCEAVARRNREAAAREVYQQQICPKCNSVVGMMVPVGAQMRAWCVPCQQYRKIVPEDMELTAEQWAAVCGALAYGYAEWRKRGAKHHESVSPVDRATAWPVNGLGPVYEIDAFTPDGLPARQ